MKLKARVIALVLLRAALPVAGDEGTEKPLALRKAIEARSAQKLQTAKIEFSLTEKDVPGPRPTYTQFFTWQCAQDGYILVHREDDQGVYKYYADGKPALAFLNKPEHFLVKDGEIWQMIEGTADAYVRSLDDRAAFRLYDIREIGLNPVESGWDYEERVRELGYPPLTYDQTMTDDLYVVTARTRGGMAKWWIDPERDWNVVRTEVFQDGKKIGERRFELQLNLHDGVWFPARIEQYRLAAGDTEPSRIIEFHSAEFNRPEHPAELTVADIGVEVGTSVTFMNRRPGYSGYWDGEQAVPLAELMERINSGELTMGPSVQRTRAFLKTAYPTRDALVTAIERAHAGDPTPTSQPAPTLPRLEFVEIDFETQWEAYTRAFIARYQLNEEQSQKAGSICAECQQQARAYVAAHRAEFEKLDAQLRVMRSGPPDDSRERRLRAHREALMQPITRIFEDRLKPRLDKLPTRAQRKAAERDARHEPGASRAAEPGSKPTAPRNPQP